MFFSLPLYTHYAVFPRQPGANSMDIAVFAAFFLGVAVCFLLSALFHTINNHSPHVAAFGNQLDYLGIVLLMWGATIPTVYYGFYQDVKLMTFYWAVVSALGVVCCTATVHPRFRTPAFRPFRAAVYAGLGFSALGFIVHGISLHGFAEQNRRMSLDWMALMALLNLVGAATYAIRVPEKARPYKFDVYGSSHQILHFMVILAGFAHVFGLFRAFHYAHERLTKAM